MSREETPRRATTRSRRAPIRRFFKAISITIAAASLFSDDLDLALAQPAPATSSTSQPTGQAAKVAAQALFEEAMALRKKGAIADACSKLDESLRLDNASGTKFYLAECMEQTGKLASAWLLYTEVADAMAASGQQKREVFARERVAALAPKLARLQINVPASARVPGLVVKRDGVALGQAQWSFAAPVDFGAHTVEVTAPNARPFTRTVDVLKQGVTVTVDVPSLGSPSNAADPAPTACAVTTSAPTAETTAAPPPPPFFSGTFRPAGVAIAGLGAAGLVVGGVLGGLAIGKQNESNKGPCDLSRDVCSREGLALRADAITAATGSTVAFIAGGVLVAAGVVLVVLPGLRPAQTAVVARPGGLSLEGRW